MLQRVNSLIMLAGALMLTLAAANPMYYYPVKPPAAVTRSLDGEAASMTALVDIAWVESAE